MYIHLLSVHLFIYLCVMYIHLLPVHLFIYLCVMYIHLLSVHLFIYLCVMYIHLLLYQIVGFFLKRNTINDMMTITSFKQGNPEMKLACFICKIYINSAFITEETTNNKHFNCIRKSNI